MSKSLEHVVVLQLSKSYMIQFRSQNDPIGLPPMDLKLNNRGSLILPTADENGMKILTMLTKKQSLVLEESV
ncbi:hypothetical protein M3Y98_00857500 [Aphelenchoides besseyi]|nr:hypothetical protein M3Y98_00857500 [Aphelenchoides besseyi]KAI6211144.1 hypothetical protein M3Y96_00402600 [Aphelenchoides besseyi]